jgi:hypothetical protein
MARYTSVQAAALLLGTGAYIWWRIATGNDPHVCVGFILAGLLAVLMATYFIWDWRRLQRTRR